LRSQNQVVDWDGGLPRFSALRETLLARPLTLPTLRRSTPIGTTALSFGVRLDPEGKISVRLTI
jgi:hypothetical protein